MIQPAAGWRLLNFIWSGGCPDKPHKLGESAMAMLCALHRFAHLQIVAQLNTFILVAFESTAAAIVFTIYHIAQHPAVEARLVQELTAAR